MSALIKSSAYVNGEWVSAKSGKTFAVTNPTNGQHIIDVPNMDADDTRWAIDVAEEAFLSWRETTAKERSNLLRRWYNLCLEFHEELAKIVTLEQGKPLAEARGELNYGLSYLEWFSEEARRINGEHVPSPIGTREMIFVREPIGVAAMITPWNFPSAMITRKMGAALASGCTCVLKPAEDTPLSALALMVLAEMAGFPKGVVNVLTCTKENAAAVGKVLSESPKVGALSFTGSTNVGKLLYRQCAGTVKKVSLELGGNAAFIVFDSAEVDLAVAGCILSKFRNTGQSCISSNRIFVHSKIYDEFIAKLNNAVDKKVVVGNGMENGVNLGPLINQNQMNRIVDLVEEAKSEGAKVMMGGSKHESGDLFFEPTILIGIKPEMAIFKKEIFGPVFSIIKFDSEEEVIAMANDTRYGLAGYFYSNDVRQCWRVARKLEVGLVGINEGFVSCVEGAFGGVKESGLGREGSKYGIDEYTEIKYISFGDL